MRSEDKYKQYENTISKIFNSINDSAYLLKYNLYNSEIKKYYSIENMERAIYVIIIYYFYYGSFIKFIIDSRHLDINNITCEIESKLIFALNNCKKIYGPKFYSHIIRNKIFGEHSDLLKLIDL